MSSVAPAVEPVGPARTSGLSAILEQTRYVLSENKVTGFAFGLKGDTGITVLEGAVA